MQAHFPNLVYVDLFAGCGRNEFPDGSLIEGSPLIAARTQPAFTKLIFVEQDPQNAAALRARVERDFSHRSIKIIEADCNVLADEVVAEIPPASKGRRRPDRQLRRSL
jgi:three-Cys-motif partner protein